MINNKKTSLADKKKRVVDLWTQNQEDSKQIIREVNETSQSMMTITFDDAGCNKLGDDKKKMEINKEKMNLIVGEMEK